MRRTVLLAAVFSLFVAARAMAEVGPFGELRLVDEVIAGQEKPGHLFVESAAGISSVQQILGRPTRVVANAGETSRYVSLRLGAGRGLTSGKAYVLQVEYPEDAPRCFSVHNRASETSRGLYTGPTVGDALSGKYVDHNPESINYPLSGKHEPFQMLFFMQERSYALKVPREGNVQRDLGPADGVPVLLCQWKAANAPLSQGAAYSRIALYEVVDPAALKLKINYPPEGLPRRHLFWREEMSDGVVNAKFPGWKDDIDWYETKAMVMQFLGMNTFTVDMLEFGHNQGWDSAPGGPNWLNASSTPKRWENILSMLRDEKYDFTILPYYEYAGSVGGNSPGSKRLARPLGDSPAYTHVEWSEKAYADVTEPEVLEDAKKVLDLTVARWKDVMPFTGAWLRVRPSHIPVSFSDNAIAKFSKEVGKPATRQQLRERGELYKQYLAWWNDQRKAFFVALRDHLRATSGNKDAVLLFTADASEPGISLIGPGRKVISDDPAKWKKIADELKLKFVPLALSSVVKDDLYLKSLLSPHGTWAQWEWEHSLPAPDPANYKETDGVLLTYPFNRLYTVESAKAFDAFRNLSGLAAIRHYALNEHELDEDMLGYSVVDYDRTREHMMHAEILAMANGDPDDLGYLAGHVFTRGFPEYARRFNQAFLSLPALPSKLLAGAASDPEVVVRSIGTPDRGTWLAVINTGLKPKAITLKLPTRGAVTNAATGDTVTSGGDSIELKMDAVELRTFHIR